MQENGKCKNAFPVFYYKVHKVIGRSAYIFRTVKGGQAVMELKVGAIGKMACIINGIPAEIRGVYLGDALQGKGIPYGNKVNTHIIPKAFGHEKGGIYLADSITAISPIRLAPAKREKLEATAIAYFGKGKNLGYVDKERKTTGLAGICREEFKLLEKRFNEGVVGYSKFEYNPNTRTIFYCYYGFRDCQNDNQFFMKFDPKGLYDITAGYGDYCTQGTISKRAEPKPRFYCGR